MVGNGLEGFQMGRIFARRTPPMALSYHRVWEGARPRDPKPTIIIENGRPTQRIGASEPYPGNG
jgi:hypothetical protein